MSGKITNSEMFVPTHAHGVFSLPLRVYNHDIDAGRVVFVANYLKFMERARTEWLRAIGVHQRDMERRQRAAFVVRDVRVHCAMPAYLDDLLNVTVMVEGLRRTAIILRQTVMRETTLCTAVITAVCVNVTKFRPIAIPEGIRHSFELEWQRALGLETPIATTDYLNLEKTAGSTR